MNRYFSSITALFLLFIFCRYSFSENIGRNIYGVMSETYQGLSINNPSAGNDNAALYTGSRIDSTDRIEGNISYHTNDWFSIAFVNAPLDMSMYSNLCFSAKVIKDDTDTAFDTKFNNSVIKIENNSGDAAVVNLNSSKIIRTDLAEGEVNDGVKKDSQWHTYSINLSEIADSEFLSNIKCPLVVASVLGNKFLIDNVYWKRTDSTGTFSIKTKNTSNNAEIGITDKIVFDESAFRQGWVAAKQYFEIDFDKEIPAKNCYVQIYTDNGKASRNGLYNNEDNEEIVLPMCFRVNDVLISTTAAVGSGTDSLNIKAVENGDHLYDSGRSIADPGYYTWLFIQDKSKTDFDIGYSKVWDIVSGAHMSEGASYVKNLNGIKIYLGANFSDALGGLIYTSQVTVAASYE